MPLIPYPAISISHPIPQTRPADPREEGQHSRKLQSPFTCQYKDSKGPYIQLQVQGLKSFQLASSSKCQWLNWHECIINDNVIWGQSGEPTCTHFLKNFLNVLLRCLQPRDYVDLEIALNQYLMIRGDIDWISPNT